MPVPWEALIPFGLLTVMFGAAGTFIKSSRKFQDQGKTPRYHVDKWEEMMMKRDERLTGHLRGQTDSPTAPANFPTNSVWYTQSTS
ncbi:NdufA1, NADH dehydrogenase 1 alpha subcomplex, 1, 7.5kDa [Agaricus bisporus var. burnettii JB137-S8]|uniref:NADH dehydrogenase [ubiquinone] 1 alpha subcomplex subunit 1 n=2 Tax=Agaricus bisporus var. burnettii TaxID=192524 RepID=K5XXH1_AGABU|nr:NdufA1, NADH dehydrogenase 1 alpha subcomplex, 1, 7.5kDa [Agaricus bisporus var. burnettii JB137-S8]EKM79995.1 NdufA1, NADH dehydrogenase 1 alpha subcomplex, 1, 7.5kDa [Agaricus bisporus var. burnettii JB137-S8]KAF7775829.1 hypothetical protein Agabi119p4_4222 [Agaricus bisporus var. burnettii]